MDIDLSKSVSDYEDEHFMQFETKNEYGDVLKAFELVVDNEKGSVILLEPQENIVMLILDYIQHVEGLENQISQIHYQLMRLQSHRLEFLVQSYSHCRLQKLLNDHMYYTKHQQNLTSDEQQHLDRYSKLWLRSYNNSLSRRMRDALVANSATAQFAENFEREMNQKFAESVQNFDEKLAGLYCVSCLEDVQIEGQFYLKGTQVIAAFTEVQQLLIENQIKLICQLE